MLHSVGVLTPADVQARDSRGVLEWTDSAFRDWFRSSVRGSAGSHLPLFYEILGASTQSSGSEIAAAYRRAIGLAHPDAGGEERRAQLVNEAYATLRDPIKRAAYDRSCRAR
jgi:DnaJ-class molecular chaperone